MKNKTRFAIIISLLIILFSTGTVFAYNKYQTKNAENLAAKLKAEKHRNDKDSLNKLVKNELKNEPIEATKPTNATVNAGAAANQEKAAPTPPTPKAEPAVATTAPVQKVAYLTFDDGPSANVTPLILDILKKYDIKATFFVLGHNAIDNKDLILRTFAEGHVVANHTYNHDTKYLYADPKNLVADTLKCDAALKSIVPSYNLKIMRFPTGSQTKPKAFKQAILDAGYKSYDWNCLSRDAEINNPTADQLLGEIKKYTHDQASLIVLNHDSAARATTAEALPRIIEFLKSKGYIFKTL